MTPPALGLWLLRRFLPRGLASDIPGDLTEEYALKRGETGPLRARLWFLYQVIGTLAVLHTRYRRTPAPRRPPGGDRDQDRGTLMSSCTA